MKKEKKKKKKKKKKKLKTLLKENNIHFYSYWDKKRFNRCSE